MKWFAKRLTEPSSAAGAGMLWQGVQMLGQNAKDLNGWGLVACGLFAVLKPEAQSQMVP